MYTEIMSTDLAQYHELYVTTSRELINTMKTNLQKLKHNFDDSTAIDEFHRAAHSLKSQSLVMGYQQIGMVNRQLEAFFKLIKEKELEFRQEYFDMTNEIVLHIERALADIKASEHESELEEDIKTLQKHTNIQT